MRLLSCCLAALALTLAGCAVNTAQPGSAGTHAQLGLDGSEPLVFADPRVDVGEVVFSPRRHMPLAVAPDPAAQEWQVLDPAFAPVLQGHRRHQLWW